MIHFDDVIDLVTRHTLEALINLLECQALGLKVRKGNDEGYSCVPAYTNYIESDRNRLRSVTKYLM